MEGVAWKLTSPCVTQIANGNLRYGSGTQTQRGGVGGGREVQEGWDVCMLMADSC